MKRIVMILGLMMMFSTFANADAVYCQTGLSGSVTAYSNSAGSEIRVNNDSNEKVTVTIYWRTACGGSSSTTISLEPGAQNKFVTSVNDWARCALSPVSISGANCK